MIQSRFRGMSRNMLLNNVLVYYPYPFQAIIYYYTLLVLLRFLELLRCIISTLEGRSLQMCPSLPLQIAVLISRYDLKKIKKIKFPYDIGKGFWYFPLPSPLKIIIWEATIFHLKLKYRNFFIQTIVLWGCRHVTEDGLLALVNKCSKLESINVWGMRVPLDCFIGLLTISPALQIRPKGILLHEETLHAWPVY